MATWRSAANNHFVGAVLAPLTGAHNASFSRRLSGPGIVRVGPEKD
jgi:hypothetical protein